MRVVSMLKSTMLSCGQSTIVLTLYHVSLVPRPFPAPVFDCLQYDQQLQVIKNWSRGRPGNEARITHHMKYFPHRHDTERSWVIVPTPSPSPQLKRPYENPAAQIVYRIYSLICPRFLHYFEYKEALIFN